MRVVIDATGPVIGGGVTYLNELVPKLCAASPQDSILLFVRTDFNGWKTPAVANCHVLQVALPERFRVAWRLAWQQAALPLWLCRTHADVLLAPFDVTSVFSPRPVVLGIQNANPWWGPQAHTSLGRTREHLLQWLTRLSALRADKVYFVSAWARDTIGRKLGLPAHKSCVIHLGVPEQFVDDYSEQPPNAFGPDQPPYVLAVGSMRSHKDYITLLKAWRLFLQAAPTEIRKLLIVGPILEPAYYRQLTSLAHDLDLQDSVSFVPGVSHDEMPNLYRNSAVLVMPSFAETFGLPLLEAMACSTPVIASAIPAAQEVCGEAARYYRPGDPADLAERLRQVLTDQSLRLSMIRRGREQARQYSWENNAEQTLQLLRDAANV